MEWCVSMPKIELHAHLNGSIRDSTLLELARELGEKGAIVFSDVEHVILKHDRSLTEVFKLFDLIHVITTDHKTVTRITKEVIEDFAADNVVYLELRTTPKRNDLKGMSKRSYMEAVLEGIRSVSSVEVDLSYKPNADSSAHSHFVVDLCNGRTESKKKIYVRLLLSIDRRETAEAAIETGVARELGEKGAIVFSDVEHVILKHDRSLTEVFKLFDLIHVITTDHKTVTRITKEVIEDFAADNVVYLELRTTPKRNDLKGMSKCSYMEAILEGIRSVSSVEVLFFLLALRKH